jgi:hypothetical protein
MTAKETARSTSSSSARGRRAWPGWSSISCTWIDPVLGVAGASSHIADGECPKVVVEEFQGRPSAALGLRVALQIIESVDHQDRDDKPYGRIH